MAPKRPTSEEQLERARLASRRAQSLVAPEAASRAVSDFRSWLPTISPHYVWDWPYQTLLINQLDRVTRGEVDRLMIFMPPRHGKSTLSTIHYAAWRLERDPRLRIIVACYGDKLAKKFSREIRKLLAGRITLSRERNSVVEWETAQGGGVLIVSGGTSVIGFGANLILIDDPIRQRVDAESENYREKVADWYSDLYQRREPGCAIILIQTRWHTDDLAGKLLQEQETGGDLWEVVSLPAVAEAHDPLGRAEGAALCPARFPLQELERIRARASAYEWASVYQQHPVPNEGAVFKVDWFKRTVKSAPDGLRWARYWDLAVSTKSRADYTASAAVALDRDGTLYIRDMVRGRWEWPDAHREMRAVMKSEARTVHGIEEALHGLAAVQELRRERTLLNVSFRGVRVTKDKLSRALAWAERAAEGKVVLVEGPWIGEFSKEVCAFTGRGDTHDDQVDSISGGVEMLAKGGRGRVAVF